MVGPHNDSGARSSQDPNRGEAERVYAVDQCQEIARSAIDLESMFHGIARTIFRTVAFGEITVTVLDSRGETGDLVLQTSTPDWLLTKHSRGAVFQRNVLAAHELLAVGSARTLVRETNGWSSDSAVAPDLVGEGFQSAIGVPLIAGQHRVGSLIIRFQVLTREPSQIVSLLSDIALAIAGHVNKAAANSRARNDIQDLLVLNDMARAMAVADSAQSAAQVMRQHLARLFDFDGIWIGIWNSEFRQFDALISHGLTRDQIDAHLSTGYAGHPGSYMPSVDRLGAELAGPRASAGIPKSDGGRTDVIYPTLHAAVVSGDELVGAVYVRRAGRNRFTERESILLQETATQAAGVLKKARTTVPVSRFNEVLRRTVSLASRVSRLDNLFDACSRFSDDIYSIVPYSRITVELVNPSEELVCCVFVQGTTNTFGPPISPFRNSQVELLAREGHGVLLGDDRNRLAYPRFGWLEARMESHGWRSGISTPIIHLGKTIGALHLRHRDQSVYSEEDRLIIESAAAVLGPVAERARGTVTAAPGSLSPQPFMGADTGSASFTFDEDTPGLQLVLVDRNRRSRDSLQMRLESIGYRVRGVFDSSELVASDALSGAAGVVLYVATSLDNDSLETTNREVRQIILSGHAVVVLTDGNNDHMLSERIDRDVGGILPTSASETALHVAISQAIRGGRVIDPQIVGMFQPPLRDEGPQIRNRDGDPTAGLNEKELAIMKLLIAGETNRSIGHELNLASGTVKNRVSGIYRKLGVSRRAEAITATLRQAPDLTQNDVTDRKPSS